MECASSLAFDSFFICRRTHFYIHYFAAAAAAGATSAVAPFAGRANYLGWSDDLIAMKK